MYQLQQTRAAFPSTWASVAAVFTSRRAPGCFQSKVATISGIQRDSGEGLKTIENGGPIYPNHTSSFMVPDGKPSILERFVKMLGHPELQVPARDQGRLSATPNPKTWYQSVSKFPQKSQNQSQGSQGFGHTFPHENGPDKSLVITSSPDLSLRSA